MFQVKFADKEMRFDAPLSVFDAAKEAELVTRAHVAAKVNGKVVGMTQLLESDADVELLTFEDAEGKQSTFKITGSQEANPMLGKLSDDSPFGRAAVGKGVGEKFTYNAPMGTYTMKIVAITREG